jgi:NTF2 fold immunity protein of polymorphic toxin system component
MKNRIILLCAVLCVSGFGQGYKPKSGFVPDSTTAVKIAEAVLIPVYGPKQIESERPFVARLKDGVWIVDGTLHCPGEKGENTTSCDGGTAEVRIAKDDGRVLFMIHYK